MGNKNEKIFRNDSFVKFIFGVYVFDFENDKTTALVTSEYLKMLRND